MAPRFLSRPITRLFILLIGILFALTLIGSYGFYAIQQELLANSGESLGLAAVDIADKIDRFLHERLEDIDFAINTLDFQKESPDKIADMLEGLKKAHPSFHFLAFVEHDGSVTASTTSSIHAHNLAAIPGIGAIKDGISEYVEVSESFHDKESDISLIMTKALTGPSKGAIIAEIPISYFEQVFSQTQHAIQQARQTTYPIEWQLLSNTGHVMLDSILHEEGKVSLTKLDLPSALLVTSGQSGFIEEIHKRRHVPVITGFAQTKGLENTVNSNWGVLIRIDQSDVLPAIHMKIFQLGIVMGFVLIPLVAMIFWTTRKAEKEHLRVVEAENKYRSIFENAPEGIFQATPSGQFLSANPAMASLLGYDSPHELIQSSKDLKSQLYSDENQQRDLLQKLEQADFVNNFEFQFSRRDGNARWGSGNVRAVKGANAMIRYLEGSVEDITERKHAAARLRQLQDQLLFEQSERTKQVETELDKAKATIVTQAKLATLGQISGSIAHELRNPLGAMRNALFLLRRRALNQDAQTKRYFDMLEEEIQNSDMIIQGLLEVARGKDPIKQKVSLQLLLDKVLKEERFPETVVYEFQFDPDPFEIWVDPSQFTQVLHNLLHNACQAMEAKGKIWVQATSNSDSAEIVISDTGPGISREHQDQLFEPLFTTKAKGTGLGLTLCREIIERHGGSISTTDNPGTGATFCIRLPLYHPPDAEDGDSHHQIM